jgi:protein-L-isoaspartate(D-aspartate) O-methyltransferase
MGMKNSLERRDTMIFSQLKVSRVNDEKVLKAIRNVARELFLPPERQAFAYVDEDVEIVPGRYLMEPMVFGRLLVNAEISTHDKVLVVGGNGYAASIIAQLADSVVALEEDATLAAQAQRLLGNLAPGAVKPVQGPLVAGWPAEAPYDIIFLDGSVHHIPQALIDQLSQSGRLVGILLEDGVGRGVVGRKSGSGFGLNPFMDAFAAPLPGFALPKQFIF